jgi:hypothetical protein
MASAIFQRYTDNILLGVTPTATVAPSTSYSLATLATLNPAARVRWSVKTVTITFTISSAQGDILVIPMHNLDPGASVLTLTNGAGFSHAITIPAVQADGFPPTLVVDLTSFSSRTSTVWNLVIVSNSVNVTFGGCIAIYGPKRSFLGQAVGDNFAWGFHESETPNVLDVANEYGTPYVQDYGTVNRKIAVDLRASSPSGLTAIRDWFRANHGRARPSLFWPDPTSTTSGLFGRWSNTFDVLQQMETYKPISLTFDEWPKGQAL